MYGMRLRFWQGFAMDNENYDQDQQDDYQTVFHHTLVPPRTSGSRRYAGRRRAVTVERSDSAGEAGLPVARKRFPRVLAKASPAAAREPFADSA